MARRVSRKCVLSLAETTKRSAAASRSGAQAAQRSPPYANTARPTTPLSLSEYKAISASAASAITPSSTDITLPKSLSNEPPANYLVVTITKKAVLVEGQSVVTLQNGKVPNTAKTSADSYEIKDLKDALNLFGKVFEGKAKDSGKPYERQMLLVADKDTPYLVVASVVATAGAAKFYKFQMVVVSTTSG